MSTKLENTHLADLHARAAELGIDGYRKLPRARLIEAIDEAGGGGGSKDSEEGSDNGGRKDGGGRGRGSRRGRGRGRGKAAEAGSRKDEGKDRGGGDDEPDEPAEPAEGILDITPRGHGFIRLEGLEAADGDIYVSPSQIRRCELQRGDLVKGPARGARRGERHPALVHVDTVNGVAPGEGAGRFEELTAAPPARRIVLDASAAGSPDGELLVRAIDLLTPLARGQRVLVDAARGSGTTTLMRALAAALAAEESLEVIVLLVDERPEEEAAWREALPEADLAIAGADMRSGEQVRTVELALARATRKAEAGTDVVLLVDSLSRIAVAADDPGRVKPIFGAGRELAEEGSGSLTVIATTLKDSDDEGAVSRAVVTTENVLIALDADLAEAGVYPAIDAGASRITGEELIRSEEELAAVRELRESLAGLSPRDAAERLREKLEEQ